MSFSQLEKTDFFEKFWEKESRLFPAGSGPFETGLFTWQDLEARCRFSPAPGMELNMPFRGNKIDRREYMRTEKVADFDKIKLFYEGGATIVGNSVQRFSNRLLAATSELELMLGCSVNTNLYLTPRGSQGFEVHSDTHDVFVLQAEGKKHWDLYDQPFPLLNRQTNLREKPEPEKEPLRKLILETGDMLYVPRGEAHAAYSTRDSNSMHLTVGPQSMSWNRMMCDLVNLAAHDEVAMRESFPVVSASAFPSASKDELQHKARSFFENIDIETSWEEVVQHYFNRIPGTCQPFPDELVFALETLDAIESGEQSCRWCGAREVSSKTRDVEFKVSGRGFPVVILEKYRPILDQMQQMDSDFSSADFSEFSPEGKSGLFCRYLANQGLLVPSSRS